MDNNNNNNIKTIRLTKSTYNRPNQTITDTLQNPEAYKEKLKGYIEVDDIDGVTKNTHVRYFVYDIRKKCWMFRTGGILKKKDHSKYVVLSNGKYTWCVQRRITNDKTGDVYETKFFKILDKQQMLEIALNKQNEEIEKLKRENQFLKNQVYSINNTY